MVDTPMDSLSSACQGFARMTILSKHVKVVGHRFGQPVLILYVSLSPFLFFSTPYSAEKHSLMIVVLIDVASASAVDIEMHSGLVCSSWLFVLLILSVILPFETQRGIPCYIHTFWFCKCSILTFRVIWGPRITFPFRIWDAAIYVLHGFRTTHLELLIHVQYI